MFTKKPPHQKAILALADGSLFYGLSLGYSGTTIGEVVFNTAMTGYQEILTDPSYTQQIVTLTYPHIGNVGVNSEDIESSHLWVSGLIVRNYSKTMSNWRASVDLQTYLAENHIVGIHDIDTRALTRILREKGAQSGCITTELSEGEAIRTAASFGGLANLELVSTVTTDKIYEWTEGSWFNKNPVESPLHVVVVDFGVKYSILRRLVDCGCKVTVVPAHSSLSDILNLSPSGIVLSNGPGDPAACTDAIALSRALMEKKIPILGVCLGFQILALASGATTSKMAYGHHGANHPIRDERSKKVSITSQNHGFCVDEASLPSWIVVTHRSLFDGTLQGLSWNNAPVIALQGHPEAGPGPNDATTIFDEFIHLMS